jgi:hypothetical protein
MPKLALAALCATVALALPAAASAADMTPVGTVDVSGSVVAVNNGPGDQLDSHVSGNLVSYTDFSGTNPVIRYHDLAADTDNAIPGGSDFDVVSAIRGSTIVYTDVAGATQAISEFDTSNPSNPPQPVDPQTNSLRQDASVGDQLIAWEDYTNAPSDPQIFVYDRGDGTTVNVSNAPSDYNVNPAVSPTGAAVTWTECGSPDVDCNIWSATRSGGTWTLNQLTSDGTEELPGTDGTIVASRSR